MNEIARNQEFDSLISSVQELENEKEYLSEELQKIKERFPYTIKDILQDEKQEEATEAIRTVIALYGRSPEFSDFRKQVGAVVSSYRYNIT